jgi:DNA-binding NtrC family response regulator
MQLGARSSVQSELASTIKTRSIEQWGQDREIDIIGLDPALLDAQQRLAQFSPAEAPVLITGGTGTGKELFARALYLLSPRRRCPFISVNCAKYQDSQLLQSELFGHKKGSFTGAVADRLGIFEEAHSGFVFLDEIGELPPPAQAMLLRTLSEGEVVRIGENRPRQVNVRTVAATARDLEAMAERGTFRADLLFRLRFLHLRVPPLRERGKDWQILAAHYLQQLSARFETKKAFADDALAVMAHHSWPGNVRELRAIVEVAFHSSAGQIIRAADFTDQLGSERRPAAGVGETRAIVSPDGAPEPTASTLLKRMVHSKESFWEVVHTPFIARDLNRTEVCQVIRDALEITDWRYKRLLPLLGIDEKDYLKFMDFLRHHQLKPLRNGRPTTGQPDDRRAFERASSDQPTFDDESGA